MKKELKDFIYFMDEENIEKLNKEICKNFYLKNEEIKDKNIEKNEIKKLYELEKLGKIDYSSKIIEQYYENGNLKSRLTDIHTKETLEEYDENGKLINEECGE